MTTTIDRGSTFIVRLDVLPDAGEDITAPTYEAGLNYNSKTSTYEYDMTVTADPVERCIVAVLSAADVAALTDNTPYKLYLFSVVQGIRSCVLYDDIQLDPNTGSD